MKNPIYIEYYSHEKALCYKIDLPFTSFNKDTVVLCRVDAEHAKELAEHKAHEMLLDHFSEAVEQPISER